MYCIECGNLLPALRDDATICSKCKTPLATWWDESTQTYRTNRESLLPSPDKFYLDGGGGAGKEYNMLRKNDQSIEERLFNAALVMLEGHFEGLDGVGSKSMGMVKKMVGGTLDASLNRPDVREHLAKNVDIWQRLRRIVDLATPLLNARSLRESFSESGAATGLDVPESATLILKHYDVLVQDLHYLNNLLVISRNMLAIKDTAQDLCHAVGFDRAVTRLVVLCVNVTSKGYDGENVDEASRVRLNEVTELYKKLLVTCLQHTHNWTMGNDRFKMSFWFDMLFDNDLHNDTIHDPPDNLDVEKVYQEVCNWLRRNGKRDPLARQLLDKYTEEVATGNTPGPLPIDEDAFECLTIQESTSPVWKADLEDKFEQDRLYARVSHEIDIWWKRVRDVNYEGWVVGMESVEDAIALAQKRKEAVLGRYLPVNQLRDGHYEETGYLDSHEHTEQHPEDDRSLHDEHEEDDLEDDEDEEDDDSYIEGPLRGLLTEIPNILDTKQIEALHMTVKACIVDSMGSGLTPAGENLQKTRCKMFLALDCGKNLLREMLVFIAVWEQNDQQFIFQITAQIIESFHHNALLPYAWDSLKILKDIVSPAQTVLLRLINYMFRARKDSPIYDDVRDYNRDAKLIHFLYKYFRCRVVPDCLALMRAQAEIRQNKLHPGDFPVDLWDMERAKDGLTQYLDFIAVVAEIPEMRPLLIEWEAVYELLELLKALEAGVARRPLDATARQTHYDDPNTHAHPHPPPQNLPPLHDTPHLFPWTNVKIQIVIILTSLVAPSNARRAGPGNPIVQKQLLAREGIMPILNCCGYDGNNEYLKERATVLIKFVMDGSEEAQKYVRDLVPVRQAAQPAAGMVRSQSGAQSHAHAQGQANARALPTTLAANAATAAAAQQQQQRTSATPATPTSTGTSVASGTAPSTDKPAAAPTPTTPRDKQQTGDDLPALALHSLALADGVAQDLAGKMRQLQEARRLHEGGDYRSAQRIIEEVKGGMEGR